MVDILANRDRWIAHLTLHGWVPALSKSWSHETLGSVYRSHLQRVRYDCDWELRPTTPRREWSEVGSRELMDFIEALIDNELIGELK